MGRGRAGDGQIFWDILAKYDVRPDAQLDIGEFATLVADMEKRGVSYTIEETVETQMTQLLEAGLPKGQLRFFESVGLVQAEERDGVIGFTGDDLALLRVLGAARRAGIRPDMLPHTILEPYMRAVRDLAALELDLFEQGVSPHVDDPEELQRLVDVASELSERLVMVLRRKMIQAIVERRREKAEPSTPPPAPSRLETEPAE